MGRYVLTSLVVAACLCGSGVRAGSKLAEFERDASRTRWQSRRDYHGRDGDACFSYLVADILWDGVVMMSAYGGANSVARIRGFEVTGIDVEPRRPGEPSLSFARCDVGYQFVESDIDAVDVRLEAGYGPLGVHADLLRFWEDVPPARLDILQVFGLYRMSFGAHVEVDLGVGALSLNGDQSLSRVAVTLPVLVHPHPNWGVEIRPAWAERITDVDGAMLFTAGPVSLKAGYRALFTPNETLHGPYAGLSARF